MLVTDRYMVWIKGNNSAYSHPDWDEKERPKQFCQECRRPFARTKPIDVRVDYLGKGPLTYVVGAGINYIRQDLLEFLQPEAQECLLLGTVFNDKKQRVDGLFTLLGKELVNLRGNKSSSFRLCKSCGAQMYLPAGKRYLLESQLLSKAPIVEAQIAPLVISEPIYRRLLERKWQNLGISKLPLLVKPRDGMDDLKV